MVRLINKALRFLFPTFDSTIINCCSFIDFLSVDTVRYAGKAVEMLLLPQQFASMGKPFVRGRISDPKVNRRTA